MSLLLLCVILFRNFLKSALFDEEVDIDTDSLSLSIDSRDDKCPSRDISDRLSDECVDVLDLCLVTPLPSLELCPLLGTLIVDDLHAGTKDAINVQGGLKIGHYKESPLNRIEARFVINFGVK